MFPAMPISRPPRFAVVRPSTGSPSVSVGDAVVYLAVAVLIAAVLVLAVAILAIPAAAAIAVAIGVRVTAGGPPPLDHAHRAAMTFTASPGLSFAR